MKRICAAVGLILACGCHPKKEASAPIPEAAKGARIEAASEQSPASKEASEAISSAREALKANKVDEAAAKLAQLQAQGASFNVQEAKDYRQTFSDAYDRAVEASQRGDPKGQAALQLLRAAGPR